MSELKSVYIDRTGDWVRSGNDTGKFYLKSEADKVIAELVEKNKRLAHLDLIMASETIKDLEESHKKEVEQLLMEIVKLKADYKEACDRLQTANLIKDEQLAATRHQKFMRCNLLIDYCGLKQNTCEEEKVPFWRKWYFRWCELSDKFKEGK